MIYLFFAFVVSLFDMRKNNLDYWEPVEISFRKILKENQQIKIFKFF